MGCYSLYRIVKDIILTLFGGVKNLRKFIIIIIVAIILVFIYNNKCKAVVIDTGYTDLPQVDVPDEYFNYKFVIAYYYSPQEGNCFRIYVHPNEFSISSLSYNSFFRYYERTFSPSNGFYKNYSISNISSSRVQSLIDAQSSIDTSVNTSSDWTSRTSTNTILFMINNFDLSFNGNIYPSNAENFVNPIFYNKTDFLNFQNNSLIIYPNDYGTSDKLYLHILTENATINDGTNDIYYYSNRILALNNQSQYFDVSGTGSDMFPYYNIPFSFFRFEPNKNYIVFINDNDETVNNSVGAYDFSNDYDGFSFSPTDEQLSASGVIINNQDNLINQNEEFFNNFTSDDYNENEVDSTLTDMSGASSSIDNSAYVGFFSTLFDKFEDVIDYDIEEVEQFVIPIPFTEKTIVIPSDLVYSRINETTIYELIYIFWYFIFGLYIFKFANNLIIAIKSGEIMKGWNSNNEVITSEIL